jgi:hypothetical protein
VIVSKFSVRCAAFSLVFTERFKGHLCGCDLKNEFHLGSTGGLFRYQAKLIIILPTNPSEPIVATASFFICLK